MANTVLIKRGLETNRLSYTPEGGEILWTTDDKKMYVGDGSTAGGIEVTGQTYTKTEADNRYVNISGDSMTGPLSLSGNPTASTHAATKSYVDTAVSGSSVTTEDIQDTVGDMVTGNTETAITVTYDDVNGKLNFAHNDTSSQSAVNNSNGAVIQDVSLDTYGHVTSLGSVDLDNRYYTKTNSDNRYYTKTDADNRFVNVTGDSMTGDLNGNGTTEINDFIINGGSY